MINELLTIKEFAKLAGKSQQAIYKQLNNKLSNYVKLIESHKMLKSSALLDVYGIEVEQLNRPLLNNKLNSDSTLYDILKSELDAKNELIDTLQAELALERQHSREQSDKLSVLAERSQQLHAGTIQQQLTDGNSKPDEPKKKGWFKRKSKNK